MKAKIALSVLLLISTFVVGCKTKPQEKLQYDKQLLPGQDALRKITNPADIPDFTQACMDTSALKDAISRSINYLSKPSSQKFYPSNGIAHKRAVASLTAFAGMLDSGLRGPQLNTAIRDRFDVYISVGCDDNGTVLFTGYYTPIFDGSPVQTAKYSAAKEPAGRLLHIRLLLKSKAQACLKEKNSYGWAIRLRHILHACRVRPK